MEHRPLGNTGLNVSLLGFGCAPLGSRATAGESRAALRGALDAGITFFDTADMYGLGASERIIGESLGAQRSKLVIATKCGYSFSSRLRAIAWVKPLLRPLVRTLKGVKSSAGAVMASQRSQCFDPPYIRACCDASLARLGADRLDIYFLHDPPMDVVERAEALATLVELQRAGKIRCIGLSADVDVVARALASPQPGFQVVQVAGSPIEPASITDVLPLAARAGIGVVLRQPLASGRLVNDPRFSKALASRGLPTDPGSVSSLSLRYLASFPGVASILSSMMRPEHLSANARALSTRGISTTEREALAELSAPLPPEPLQPGTADARTHA